MVLSRRRFVRTAISGAAVGLGAPSLTVLSQTNASRPIVLAAGTTSSVDGTAKRLKVTEKAMGMLRAGADTLDAVIAGVNLVEDDPTDMSVGYGGLPNEEGEVELDASVMHGPTRRAGAVAAIKNIKNPSKVAKVVMERTDHLLLAGEGALRF